MNETVVDAVPVGGGTDWLQAFAVGSGFVIEGENSLRTRTGAFLQKVQSMVTMDFGPKFPLGQIVITRNAADTLPPEDVAAALRRHVRGDWGELDDHDRQQNQSALQDGSRLLSAYRASNGVNFWIISEADRTVTTVLLPEDY